MGLDGDFIYTEQEIRDIAKQHGHSDAQIEDALFARRTVERLADTDGDVLLTKDEAHVIVSLLSAQTRLIERFVNPRFIGPTN